MHNYYFKIKKNDTELEFSTDDLTAFDAKVLDWVNEICTPEKGSLENNLPKRKDFIEIKKLVTLNSYTAVQHQEDKKDDEDFDKILNNTVENPKLELEKVFPYENELLKIVNEKGKDLLTILVIVAGYMTINENILRFSIKQINSRLVPYSKQPVSHAIIQEALDKKYIEIVPDLTGFGDVTEYSLTQEGEDFYHHEI